MAYGLLSTGFNRKTLQEIKTELIADLTAAFGTIRTDVGSVFGNLIGVLSKREADLWELFEVLYFARSISATGIALDDIVNWVGVTRLPAMPSHVNVTCTGTPTTALPSGLLVRDAVTGKQFTITTPSTIPVAGSIDVDFTCLENGPIQALAGNVTQIITPVSGLSSVTNATDASLGRNQELDAELRTRFLSARSSLGYCRLDAVRSRIIDEVDDISSCSIYENTDDVPDGEGRPAHSFEVVVDCPIIREQDVANKILEVKPLGIATYGNVNSGLGYLAADSQGLNHRIRFSKIAYKYAHVLVSLTLSSEISFPSDGFEVIRQAIKDYGDTLQIGNDLLIQAFVAQSYKAPGVSFSVTAIAVTDNPGDTPSYSYNNVAISAYELPKFALDRIHIS